MEGLIPGESEILNSLEGLVNRARQVRRVNISYNCRANHTGTRNFIHSKLCSPQCQLFKIKNAVDYILKNTLIVCSCSQVIYKM